MWLIKPKVKFYDEGSYEEKVVLISLFLLFVSATTAWASPQEDVKRATVLVVHKEIGIFSALVIAEDIVVTIGTDGEGDSNGFLTRQVIALNGPGLSSAEYANEAFNLPNLF